MIAVIIKFLFALLEWRVNGLKDEKLKKEKKEALEKIRASLLAEAKLQAREESKKLYEIEERLDR